MNIRYRRNYIFIFLFVSSLLPLMVSFSRQNSSSSEEFCRDFVLKNIEEIIKRLTLSKSIVAENLPVRKKTFLLKQQYREARKYFKEIEFFIEYYSPFESKYYINGPLVPKNDPEYGPKIFEPQGFQVIEENLFDSSKTDLSKTEKEYSLLIENLGMLKNYYSTIIIERPNLTEALRLEIIRVMCLTLNGYDCTISKETSKECAYSLSGMILILKNYSSLYKAPCPDLLHKTYDYLLKNPESDKLDRLHIIVHYLQPLYNDVCSYIEKFNTKNSMVSYGVDFRNHSVFDLTSINKQHFSLYRDDTVNVHPKQELGRLLFFDPVLSGNHKRACSSCHKPELAFTDGSDKSIGFDRKTKISRNAPTLLNAAYQKSFFYDGRIFNLEEQAGQVFHNTFEMNSSSEDIVKILKQSEEYKTLFRFAFKGTMDSSITFYAVMRSIAEYIKTLDSKNSRFDKYIKGDHQQLNQSEKNGFNLFNGKALCGSCHFYPLFNGVVPPMYNDNEFEVIGAPADSTNKVLDDDPGRENITHSPIHKNAFKTPTVRNIALTAPYMHNGSYRTLDQVLDFYNRGGGSGLKLGLKNQTLPFDSLGLSKQELYEIKSFLLALTDTAGTNHVPSRLPYFNNEALNKRKIGGEY